MRTFLGSIAALALCLFVTSRAFAQEAPLALLAPADSLAVAPADPPIAQPGPRSRPAAARPKSKVGAQIFAIVDAERMTASKSFSAVVGKTTFVNAGVGVEVTNLWQGVFARFAYTHGSRKGTRVVVNSGIAVSNGIPLTIEIAPIEVGGGWRFVPARKGTTTLVPYIGAALVLQRYKETSAFALDGENTDETDKGAAVFAGLEVDIRVVRIGIEGQYRRVPNVIGAAGASQAFNETDLGGGVVRLTFGVGF
jgi:hypothetical protein